MKVTLPSVARFTIKTLAQSPFHFFWLQSLNGLSGIIAKLLETRFENSPLVAGLLFFPIFCIASTLTCAITFISVLELQKGRQITLIEGVELLKPYLKKLILASLALGTLFVLGLAALILPALYFMAVYLFVPLLLIHSPDLTLSSALFRSSKLAKQNKILAALTVFLILFIGVLTFLISFSLGRFAGGIAETQALRVTLSTGIDAFLTMLTGAMIDLWIAGFYLKARETEST